MWLLFNAKWARFSVSFNGEIKLHLNEMMLSASQETSMLFFILLVHWNNNARVDMSLHIIPISSQSGYAHVPKRCVVSQEQQISILVVGLR